MGDGVERLGLVNEYLGYLADRRYSPRTVRAYAFDLLAFCRWLLAEGVALADVTRLSLTSCERLDHGLVHLRYAVARG